MPADVPKIVRKRVSGICRKTDRRRYWERTATRSELVALGGNWCGGQREIKPEHRQRINSTPQDRTIRVEGL